MLLVEQLRKMKNGYEVLSYIYDEAKKEMERKCRAYNFDWYVGWYILPLEQYNMLFDLIGWQLARYRELATPYGYVIIST